MLGNTQAVTTTPYGLDKEVLTANKDTIETHLDTTDKDPENDMVGSWEACTSKNQYHKSDKNKHVKNGNQCNNDQVD